MRAERWGEVERLYHAAAELAPEDRASFLADACAGDDALRREVESLLAHEPRAAAFIETTALRLTARTLNARRREPRPGQMIGSYRVVGRLGAGGMGVVYTAYDTTLKRTVALKLLPVASVLYGDEKRLLLREARAASALTHPNIATIYEVNEHDGLAFIALEYVEGSSLSARPELLPLDPKEVVRVGLQIADALDEAHRKGIIHRDIKPANIMLDQRGRVKILDFGIAKSPDRNSADGLRSHRSRSQHTSESSTPKGTAPYVSPEQMLGQKVDQRTDIFSLGAVLYELATGRAAFSGRNLGEIIDAVVTLPHAPPISLNEKIPPRLSAVIDKCLEKDRQRRYADAAALIKDLGKLAASFEGATTSVAGGVEGFAGRESFADDKVATRPRQRNTRRVHPAVIVIQTVAFITIAAVITYLAISRGARSPRPDRQINSIAVLPFESPPDDAQDSPLGIGLSDELITRLSSLKQLAVTPGSAVRRYAGRHDPLAAGRDLKVESVLEGDLRRVGGRIRLHVQLLDVESGGTLWDETFDESFNDIFAVQDRLSRDLTQALAPRLPTSEIAQAGKHYTQDAEAYALYLNGRFCLNRFTEDGTKLAREYFRKAIEKDPNYSQAYAGLAESFAFGEIGLPPAEAFPQAREAAERALRLDGSLGEAHAVLAQVKFLGEWDWDGAEREFKEAISLTPNVPEIHHMYAHYLTAMGRFDEALEESHRFIALDPISPTPVQHLGWHYLYAHQFDRAVEQYKKVLATDPNYIEAHRQLADAYWQKGMLDEAINEMEKQLVLQGRSHDSLLALRAAYRASGWDGYWRKRLEMNYQRAKETYVAPTTLAETYARLKDRAKALEWLEKAYQQRDHQLVYLNQDYQYAELRSEPRFQTLLGRLRLRPDDISQR